MKRKIIIVLLTHICVLSYSQTRTFTVGEALEEALLNNSRLKSAQYELEARKELERTSFDLPKTEVAMQYGQYNSYANDNNISVMQSIPFSALGAQGALNHALTTSTELQKFVAENEIIFKVKQTYYQLVYVKAIRMLLLKQDSIYQGFVKSATLRYQTGESNLLEQSTAEAQRSEGVIQLKQNEAEVMKLRLQLQTLINSPDLPDIAETDLLTPIQIEVPDTASYEKNPSLSYMKQQVEVELREKKYQSSKFAPDLMVGVFSQTLTGTLDLETGTLASKSERFAGFQVGLAIPIWFVPHHARVRSAEYRKYSAEKNFDYQNELLRGQTKQAIQQIITDKNNLDHYTGSALRNADMILRQSQIAFREGEIGYAEYLLGIRNSVRIRENYLKTLNDYNQSIIYFQYLTGTK